MPEPPLAAAAPRLHRGWKRNAGCVVFCVGGVSVRCTKHCNASSHYHGAAAPHSNECRSVFNWERVLLSKSYLLGNECRNLLR